MEEVKCDQIGMLSGGKWDKLHDITRRVYGVDGVSPTLHTAGGGNTELKIAEPIWDNDLGCLVNENGEVVVGSEELPPVETTKQYRIRKLTGRECFRLMGVKDEDYERVAKHQSTSSQYHLAGDSIVTACLMAIFGALLSVDYDTKINDLVEELKQGE